MGFSYSKRAGGPAQYAHAKEIAEVAIGEDPSDIAKLYQRCCGPAPRSAAAASPTQAIAALDVALWDLKAQRAGLPLAKLLGAYRDSVPGYNTSGGFLQASLEEIKEKAAASLEGGIGGIKIKVGQPDWQTDLERVAAVREHLGDSAVHGRRQPAVGPRPRPADVPRARGSSTSSGSRSRSTPRTPKATPSSAAPSTPRSPPARC